MPKPFLDIKARRKEARAIQSAQRGESAGFQFLYEKYRSFVFSICLRMTRDPTLAEDLSQDIFLHVWRKIVSFKGDAQFRTWLYRVAVNMVLLYFRRHKAVDVSLDNEVLPATELRLAENAPQPDLDEHIALRHVLRQLSPRYRRVIMLHDLHGYRHDDISQLLGITSGASRSQLHKARVKLRIALGPRPEPQQSKQHDLRLVAA
jgi:RNA polymerase sigma-70 factor (ECF subfamily)